MTSDEMLRPAPTFALGAASVETDQERRCFGDRHAKRTFF
jgi:hypothetical protein